MSDLFQDGGNRYLSFKLWKIAT